MRLNAGNALDETNNGNFNRRKKEQDAVRIDAAIKQALDELGHDRERRAALLRLLACVRAGANLLKPGQGKGGVGWLAPIFLINRLKNLAARQHHWIRSCESWRPGNDSLRLAFRSLAQHLLTFYPVPGFMDCVWDLPLGSEGFRQQSWYIRLGRGVSFRSLSLPVRLTRHQEHFVRQAPDHYTVLQAIRFGEILDLGGSVALAREVALGPLGQRAGNSEFWRTVLGFFVTHTELKLVQVNPIIDFVQANKFAGESVMTERGIGIRAALRPDFSMKGRTLQSLLRLVTGWHADLATNQKAPLLSWKPSDLPPYRFLEERSGKTPDRDWSIRELLDSGALRAEGQALRHCVYSYVNPCRHGETTIWSLRLRVNDQERRMATIEVHPRRRAIVQARAKCNQKPGLRSWEIIQLWAAWAGLQFDMRL